MEFSTFFMFVSHIPVMTYITLGKDRDRSMLFPDYYFFAERRLVSHTIETKYVKDLEYCELFCYMNDNCVSANFKKDPETGGMSLICELNNATHLEYDSDLTTDAVFYYRGSKNACAKNSLCQNDAACQSGFTIKGYRYLCPPGLEGKYCEKHIDECQANTHDCHLNATCNNTNGSFMCTCSFGFNGDGRNCTAHPCYHCTNLDDFDRKSSYKGKNPAKCDDKLKGWYRFVRDAGKQMPTTCVKERRCCTDRQGWLDGEHPTVEN
ncbi:protein jagged-1-like, partial [Stylophora pistillata]|uniref:protein jagged-1-like n=1 Tax=Stylophora pistillata TaxID=50429 RepID=UPI000C04F022